MSFPAYPTTDRGAFLVPHTAPGVHIEETWNSLAMRLSGSHDVVLENVHLPPDALIDAPDTFSPKSQLRLVLYSLDAREIGRKLGAFTNEEPSYINATGFILRPDGTIAVSVYSSGAIGRLVPTDTIKTIKNRQAKNAAK